MYFPERKMKYFWNLENTEKWIVIFFGAKDFLQLVSASSVVCTGSTNVQTPPVCIVQRTQKVILDCVDDQLENEIQEKSLQGFDFILSWQNYTVHLEQLWPD